MSKAEDRALETYPVLMCYNDFQMVEEDINKPLREIYQEGYHQAEKELELTPEDVYDIWRLYNEVCSEGQIFGHDETSEEVLKRFKEKNK